MTTARTTYVVRPLGPLLRGTHNRTRAPFTATWTSTLDLLDREIRQLGGKSWVLQVDVSDHWIRQDGGLHAKAVPASPAVRIVFDCAYGTLNYACDRYTRWQDNVRAIALSLEALRRVDRYGVAQSGEQYRGWTEIAAEPATMTRAQAAEFLAYWSGMQAAQAAAAPKSAWQQAAKRAHPDAGGDHDTFVRLTAARDLLLGGAA